MKNAKKIMSVLAILTAGSAYAQRMPSYSNVLAAQKKIEFVAKDLEQLIANPQGHVVGGGSSAVVCEELDYNECKLNHTQCYWIRGAEFNGCRTISDDGFLENDIMASRAANALSRATYNLGEEMDDAVRVHGTPQFPVRLLKVCAKLDLAIGGTNAGRIAALVPNAGHFKPEFFNSYEIEFVESKELLLCP